MPGGKKGAAKNWLSQYAGRPWSVQGRIAPVGVPTPQIRSTTSATASSNTGTRMAAAEIDNQRSQRPLRSVGTASVICAPAGTVIIALGNALDYMVLGFRGTLGDITCAANATRHNAGTFPYSPAP